MYLTQRRHDWWEMWFTGGVFLLRHAGNCGAGDRRWMRNWSGVYGFGMRRCYEIIHTRKGGDSVGSQYDRCIWKGPTCFGDYLRILQRAAGTALQYPVYVNSILLALSIYSPSSPTRLWRPNANMLRPRAPHSIVFLCKLQGCAEICIFDTRVPWKL